MININSIINIKNNSDLLQNEKALAFKILVDNVKNDIFKSLPIFQSLVEKGFTKKGAIGNSSKNNTYYSFQVEIERVVFKELEINDFDQAKVADFYKFFKHYDFVKDHQGLLKNLGVLLKSRDNKWLYSIGLPLLNCLVLKLVLGCVGKAWCDGVKGFSLDTSTSFSSCSVDFDDSEVCNDSDDDIDCDLKTLANSSGNDFVSIRLSTLVSYISNYLPLMIKQLMVNKIDNIDTDERFNLKSLKCLVFWKKFSLELVNLWIEGSLLTEEIKKSGNKSYRYVGFKSSLWKDKIRSCVYILPMLVLPLSWDIAPVVDGGFGGVKRGGYLINKKNHIQDLVNLSDYWNLDLDATNGNIFKILNYVQHVPYKINVELLEDILNRPDKYFKSLNFDVYNITFKEYLDSINFKIDNISGDSIKKTLYYGYKKEFLKLKNDCAKILNTLAFADIYKNHTIYFTWFLDFRGRMYSKGWPLSPQGDELSRSLLLLDDMGIIAKEDLKDINFIIKSKIDSNKKKNKNIFETNELLLMLKMGLHNRCKVGIDVKASAFQILGLILKDEDLLAYTRFFKNDTLDNKELDLYDFFSQHLKEKGIDLERDHCKKILMTLVYNQQGRSRAKYIMDVYMSKRGGDSEISFSEALRISNTILKVAEKLWPKLINFQTLISSLAKSLALNNKVLGIPIYKTICVLKHKYYQTVDKRVTIMKGADKKRMSLSLRYPVTGKASYQKYCIATLPNIIHSLDASLALLTIEQCMIDGIKIFSVHDCFYVHPSNIKKVQMYYHNACKKVFNNDDFWKYFVEINEFEEKNIKMINDFIKENVIISNDVFNKPMHPQILM